MAYESIVASGDNATILHYVTNRDRLEPGTLLLVDSGCELDFYASDVTRTWPVDGRFTPEQRAIYDIVLAAQEAACAQVAPGIPRNVFHDVAIRTIVAGLIELKLLSGSVDENVESERYRDYYMHGTGHWLGLDVHDAGRYRDDADNPSHLRRAWSRPSNRAFTCTATSTATNASKDRRPHRRRLLVTADGHENLTAAIPKRVEELEAIVGIRRQHSRVKVLLLGGSGFIGRALQPRCRTRGDEVVSALLRDPAGAAIVAADLRRGRQSRRAKPSRSAGTTSSK